MKEIRKFSRCLSAIKSIGRLIFTFERAIDRKWSATSRVPYTRAITLLHILSIQFSTSKTCISYRALRSIDRQEASFHTQSKQSHYSLLLTEYKRGKPKIRRQKSGKCNWFFLAWYLNSDSIFPAL